MIAELRTDTELERLVACDWLCEYGTEADWNRLLDEHHSDQQVRRRFGLWLLEQGGAKGEGYLALSACGRDCTDGTSATDERQCPYWHRTKYPVHSGLPQDWFDLLVFEGKYSDCCPLWRLNHKATREEIEEAAAVAFLRLPQWRREQLLRGDL